MRLKKFYQKHINGYIFEWIFGILISLFLLSMVYYEFVMKNRGVAVACFWIFVTLVVIVGIKWGIIKLRDQK